MNLLVLFGFKKKTSVEFNQQKNAMFNIFSQTRDKLSKLVAEQKEYIGKKIDIIDKAQQEIELTEKSIESSVETIAKLENFLN